MKSTRYDIYNNVWLTMNNVSRSWVKQFAYNCHEVCSHKRKSLANHFMNGQKSVFTVSHTSFNFSHAISCFDHTNTMKTNIDNSFHPCHQGWPIPNQHLGITQTCGAGIAASSQPTVVTCAKMVQSWYSLVDIIHKLMQHIVWCMYC